MSCVSKIRIGDLQRWKPDRLLTIWKKCPASLAIRKIQIKTKSYTLLLSVWQTSGRCITAVWRLLRNGTGRLDQGRVCRRAPGKQCGSCQKKAYSHTLFHPALSLPGTYDREVHRQVRDTTWKFSFRPHFKEFEITSMSITREMCKNNVIICSLWNKKHYDWNGQNDKKHGTKWKVKKKS